MILTAGFALICPAQNSTQAWKVQAPYPDNPFKQAMLAGNASSGKLTAKADLQVDCRADADGPRMNLLFDSKAVKFDADPFEGPGGLGERQRLTVTLGPMTWSHHFSGAYVEANIFVFSFALTRAEASQITSARSQGQALRISVDSAKGGKPVHFLFNLPSDSEPVRTMVTPCLSHLHKS
jgi:hypothetical protein